MVAGEGEVTLVELLDVLAGRAGGAGEAGRSSGSGRSGEWVGSGSDATEVSRGLDAAEERLTALKRVNGLWLRDRDGRTVRTPDAPR